MGEESAEDYSVKVRLAIQAMRRRTGMTTAEFGAALSEELSRTIRANKVTQWERGTFLPKSDIFLASMAISGAQSLDLGVNPRAMTAIRVNELQRQLRELQAARAGHPLRLPRRLDLATATGPIEGYLTAAEAAQILGVPRSQMYDFRARGQLSAYRLGTRTAFLRAEVEDLARRRSKKT